MSETETPAVVPQFIDTASRVTVEPLEWPIEYNGVVYREITIRRPTAADVRRWEKRIREAAERKEDIDTIPLPVFDAPDDVIESLDEDDSERLGVVAQRFLPRRFQTDTKSTPSSGDDMSLKQPES